ncbi:short-chain type dehydrogenase/reductase [Cnuibacter physcomitrellae]|uniref:Short-chain dehydrogenase n=1 Tax=Cnuibacter physcomitrellae TaxID=1619308 RepID=A0A1X9LQL3_9MICO|nr:SDR family oxidoreductase [Cnuibacter physcomitrellae]ARJ04190.1 short-chain dehydrogenase [Cnuibacter physcomitrellae]GGI40464.1 short-chain type dehydrogenase/reductase [Cnuibacter physcomitrellae]
MKDLSGRTAFITGGASGIGFGIAEALLARGVKVMIADLRDDHLAEARERLGHHPDVLTLAVDVIDRDAMHDAAQRMLDLFGGCDILVNNAGVGANPSVDAVTYADWEWVLSVNLWGPINGVMEFLPLMLRRGEGHIVTTSSMAGLLPTADNYIYAASKYAVRGMSDSLRLSLAPRGIGVSVLYPGLTRSRILESEENRHPRFRTGAGSTPPSGGPVAPPKDSGMDPRDVGEAVVEGIIHNRGYIISHSEFHDELSEHFESILAASPAPQEIDPGRLMLENARRAQTAAAMEAVEALTLGGIEGSRAR